MKSLKFLSLWVVPLLLAWWNHSNKATNQLQINATAVDCPTLSCIAIVDVKLDKFCEVSLLPEMVLQSVPPPPCYNNLRIEIFDLQGQSLGSTIPGTLAGKNLRYTIKDITNPSNSCEGQVRVGAKIPFSCLDTVNVQLDEACELKLLPEMVLANAQQIPCYNNLRVEVLDPQGRPLGARIPSAYVGQVLKYTVKDISSNNTCWGHVRVEDKIPPTLVCPEPTNYVVNTLYSNILSGTLSSMDPTFDRRNFTCWLSAQTPEQGAFYFDTIPFQVAKNGVYTFVLLRDFVKSDEAAGAIFQGSFQKEYPCQNIIGFTDSGTEIANRQVLGDFLSRSPIFQQQYPWVAGTFQPFIRIQLELKQNQTYYLVTTSLKSEDTGNYLWLVGRDEVTQAPNTEILKGKTVSELPWVSNLVCEDVDRVKLTGEQCYTADANGKLLQIADKLKKTLQLTGFPHDGVLEFKRNSSVKDNCGDLTICVKDVVQLPNATCDPTVIKRTFTAKDKAGNASICHQLISVRQPSALEVVLPNYTAYIECDEQFPLDSTGYPHPSVTGYPFVQTAFGLRDLKQPFCNLAATYRNKSKVDICDRAYSFIREWTILDWCNPGTSFIYNQIVKVGDFTPPTIGNLPKDPWDCVPTFTTGPFSCYASFKIPKPDTIFDNCSTWQVSVLLLKADTEEILATGLKIGDLVGNIPLGLHRFRYFLEDNCHNKRIADYWFEVVDKSVPVAKCDDFQNISITSGSTSRVFATDLEEGSRDGCTELGLKARRIFKEPTCTDTYTQLLFGKTFNSLFFKKEVDLSGYGLYYQTKVDAYFTENPDSTENPNWKNAQPVFTLENGQLFSLLRPYADLLCCDVADTVRIEVWAFDDANGNGVPGDTVQNFGYCKRTFLDNYNICWLDVLVEDKVKPDCKAPVDSTVLCTNRNIRYQSTFTCKDSVFLDSIFGQFLALDNCGARMICDTVMDKRDNCGVGIITRIYHAEDIHGNRSEPCEQRITVLPDHNYEIKFPADISGVCQIVLDTTIEVNNLGCDLLAISVFDDRLRTDADECFKIERTFRVINWCEYDGISDPVVVGRDEDCDGKPGDEAVYVLRRPNVKNELPAFIDRNKVETDKIPAAGTKGNYCDGSTNPAGYWRKSLSSGYWVYKQIIKAYDNVPPKLFFSPVSSYCSESADCAADIGVSFLVDEDCTNANIRFEVRADYGNDSIGEVVIPGERVRGQYPKFRYEDRYPFGEHSVTIRVIDGCGNAASQKVTFKVEDCKAPTPICINGLAAELMPVIPAKDVNGDTTLDHGAVTVWVKDFVKSDVADCTGPLIYSINREGEIPNINQKSLTFTCDDAGSTVPIAIYVWDNANNPRSIQPDGKRGGRNYSYCITYVLIQDNIGTCNITSGQLAVAGRITTESENPLEGAQILTNSGQFHLAQTSAQGFYAANLSGRSGKIDLIPKLDRNFGEGVSTYDIILITKHILGIQALESPYKMIAADVNNSKSITTLDVIQLRKIILSIDTKFATNTSWRFVDKKYLFPNPNNPWQEAFPEQLNLNLETFASRSDADFIAIKVGDVNNNVLQTTTREAAPAKLQLELEDILLKSNQTYYIPFYANLRNNIGYQGSLQFDPAALHVQTIEYGQTRAEHFGTHLLANGLLPMSWNAEQVLANAEQQWLFTLVVNSNITGKLSDYLTLQSRPTIAEAYDIQGNITDLELSFQTHLTFEKPFTLYPNKPNPFREETVIGFQMAAHAKAKLLIYSAEGRLVKTIESVFDPGYQEFRIRNQDLPAVGVYYYTVEVNGYRAVQKMLKN